MRNLARNKRPIAWVNYKGNEAYEDESHNLSGEKIVKYYPLKKGKHHVTGATGNSMVEVFGTDIKYDKVVLFTKDEFHKTGVDKKDHITENSVFFIDVKPAYDNNGIPMYDYVVKRIAETINEVVIAIAKR